MPSEAPEMNKVEGKPSKTLEFQSPPVLTPKISPEEHAAINGPALGYAKNLSSSAAIIAGSLGAGLGSFALITADKSHRALKIIASIAAGGIGGYSISNLPWNAKPVIALPENSLPHPSIPTIPTTLPEHPAAKLPEPSVAAPEHAGRVDSAALTTERSA